mgnify:CR=1 FL=1
MLAVIFVVFILGVSPPNVPRYLSRALFGPDSIVSLMIDMLISQSSEVGGS